MACLGLTAVLLAVLGLYSDIAAAQPPSVYLIGAVLLGSDASGRPGSRP